ncbi:MAG TPA: cobalt-precorrin-5B (C(1))-methyltransferase CbiD [Desulfobacteria bacterium]|nr:cobalt-precorrin-5B (C(1))-methyltransferase CbiD [Desulfobacteria bacterium]
MTELGYVSVEGKKLRQGFTTGSCAAAAAKAAVLLYTNRVVPEHVDIDLPNGGSLRLSVKAGELTAKGAMCCVIKDGGDDPDITHGLEIWAEVLPSPAHEIIMQAGIGVGTVTKPGLQVPVGEPAINPVPRQMIEHSVREVLPPGGGATVIISVPAGTEAAKKTLNPKLGVIGGISILGTTGIVQPMSEEAFKASLIPQLVQAKGYGHQAIVLVPGRIGAKRAHETFGIPAEAVAEMSNFVGFMLMECVAHNINEVIIMGHISKLIKVAAGIFHTHNRVADARLETLAAHCALLGMPQADLQRLMQCVTVEGALAIVQESGLQAVYEILARQVSKRSTEHAYGQLKVGTVLLNMAGDILGIDPEAGFIAKKHGWQVKI